MSIEDLRARLAECDRANPELQYSFSEVSDFCQILLRRKAELQSQAIASVEAEQCFILLYEKLVLVQCLLEETRYDIEESLITRVGIERLLASNFD